MQNENNHEHIAEIPEFPPGEPAGHRLKWLFISGLILFFMGKFLGCGYDAIHTHITEDEELKISDRWITSDQKAVLDVPKGKLNSMRAICDGDDFLLTVSKPGTKLPAIGKIYCHKNAYKVGDFTLQKLPERPNGLLLILKFEHGRNEEYKLARSQ